MLGYISILIATILGVWGWLKKDNTNRWYTAIAVSAIILIGIYGVFDRISSGPPRLLVKEHSLNKIEEGYRVTVTFYPSKNEEFNIIKITASLPEDSNSRISRVNAHITGHKYEEAISPDGKTAILPFHPTAIGLFSIEIDVDSPTTLFIEGTNGLKPFSIEVK